MANFFPTATPSRGAPNTVAISTAVAPPIPGLVVYAHTRIGVADSNCGSLVSNGLLPNQPFVVSIYIYVPTGWAGTMLQLGIESPNLPYSQVQPDPALTGQWQLLQISGTGDTIAGDVAAVFRVQDAIVEQFYSSGWVLAPVFTTAVTPVISRTLKKTIPSYLYVEYNDDDDLQAFVAAFNDATQIYVDWFNTINLPVYTNPLITGDLLDWVAAGLYGIIRPTLSSGSFISLGLLNTYMFNTLMLNQFKKIGSTSFTSIDDDTFKRIITWAFYKGDGKTFTINWLKRRIIRFLAGVNGTSPAIDDTRQVSVAFPSVNTISVVISTGPIDISMAPLLIQAISSGVCELPFQYSFNVSHT